MVLAARSEVRGKDEMRVVLPSNDIRKLHAATAGGAALQVRERDDVPDRTLRLQFVPAKSGSIPWEIEFDRV